MLRAPPARKIVISELSTVAGSFRFLHHRREPRASKANTIHRAVDPFWNFEDLGNLVADRSVGDVHRFRTRNSGPVPDARE